MMIGGDGLSIRLMSGKAYSDSWQLTRDEVSELESGDTVAVTFKTVQGASTLLTIAATALDYDTGEFSVALSAANVATLRTGCGLSAQETGSCSVGVTRTRSGIAEAAGRFTAILEPEA